MDVATGRVKRKRAKAAWHGVRNRRPNVGIDAADRGETAEIVSLVETPFATVPEAHRRLKALERAFETRDDRRAVFLTIYARVTGEVGEQIQRGEFNDPEWVSEYLVTFANLYREAVYDYETGSHDRLARPWQLAFDAAERRECLFVQDAVLGINAHINYDLALALDSVGIDPDRPSKHEDHRAVTDVLRRLVDETQDTLVEKYAPGIETLDESLGRLDEEFSIFTIDEARKSAWRTAVALHSRWRTRRRFARWVMDATSTGAAYLILSPNVSSHVLDQLRELES